MSYRGGQVMNGPVKLYTIFWGSGFPTNYDTVINQYLTDIAADSSTINNFYSVATEYFNATPGTISYSVQFDSVLNTVTDTSAYPVGCNNYGLLSMGITLTSSCLFASQIEDKVDSVISTQHWTVDGNSLFFLFTPEGVGSQFGSPGHAGSGKAYTNYCGYHSVTGGGAIYANQPYAAEHGSGSSFSTCEAVINGQGVHPNSNPADATINVLTHELMESVTDSFFARNGKFAWTDTHLGTGEIGDKCNFDFGKDPQSALDFNQAIHGNHYWVQEMYSNQGQKCALSLLDAYSANINVTGAGFSTTGVTVDIGGDTGLSPSSDTAGSVRLTGVQGPLTGPSAVNVTVHAAGGLDSTLLGGYSWGPKVTGAALSNGVLTITGSGFLNHGVTVDLQDSLTGSGGCTASGLTPTASTASVIKVNVAAPVNGSSECDVIVHSNGYTASLLSLMPTRGQHPFHFGPRITSARASGGFISITGTGFNTTGVTVDLYPAGTANMAGATPRFPGLIPVVTPTATLIKVAEPSAPTPGTSEYDVVVRSAGLTTALLGGWSTSGFAFGPHVVSAKAASSVITITGSGFSTTPGLNQVTLYDSATRTNILTPTVLSATATVLKLTEPSVPTSGSSEYDVDVKVNGLDSYLFSQNPKLGQTGFAFGPHVTAAR